MRTLKILKFYKDDCQPCKMLTKMLESINLGDIADKLNIGFIEIVSVDVTLSPDLVKQYNISGVPTLVSDVGDKLVGLPTKEKLVRWIEAQLF